MDIDLTTTQRIWRNVKDNQIALLQARSDLRHAMDSGDERAQKQFGDQITYLEAMMSESIGPKARNHANKNGVTR